MGNYIKIKYFITVNIDNYGKRHIFMLSVEIFAPEWRLWF